MSSREYKEKRIVLWAANIDSSRSISEGRKIPLKYAVSEPSVEEIVLAAKMLGLKPAIEEKAYPRSWWKDKHRIVVDKLDTKRNTLVEIAKKVRKLREK